MFSAQQQLLCLRLIGKPIIFSYLRENSLLKLPRRQHCYCNFETLAKALMIIVSNKSSIKSFISTCVALHSVTQDQASYHAHWLCRATIQVVVYKNVYRKGGAANERKSSLVSVCKPSVLNIDNNRHRCYTALIFGRPGTQGYHSVKGITIQLGAQAS